jgi:hypothetical protein
VAIENWSFKKNNSKPGDVEIINPLDILLFNKFKSLGKYSELANNMTWGDFQKFNFEDPIISKAENFKRYITFVCYDMYGKEESLRFIVDSTSHHIINTLHLDLASINRQVTSKVYVDNFYLAGKKPTDQRLYASL